MRSFRFNLLSPGEVLETGGEGGGGGGGGFGDSSYCRYLSKVNAFCILESRK